MPKLSPQQEPLIFVLVHSVLSIFTLHKPIGSTCLSLSLDTFDPLSAEVLLNASEAVSFSLIQLPSCPIPVLSIFSPSTSLLYPWFLLHPAISLQQCEKDVVDYCKENLWKKLYSALLKSILVWFSCRLVYYFPICWAHMKISTHSAKFLIDRHSLLIIISS